MLRSKTAEWAAVAVMTAACAEIVDPDPQLGLDDRMIVTAVLDPTASRHAVLASPVEVHGPPLSGTHAAMYRRTGASQAGWSPVASAGAVGDSVGDEEERLCRQGRISHHIGVHGTRDFPGDCMILDAVLEPGQTYRIEVSADGRPTASGTATVVGDFDLESAVLSTPNEAPPVLALAWTPSHGAARYLAGLGRRERPNVICVGCPAVWFADQDSAGFVGPVPQEAVDSAGPDPFVSVAALDRNYHAFLTTGHAWHLFSVSPRMNVEGGIGVIGSAMLRSLPVATGSPSAAAPAPGGGV